MELYTRLKAIQEIINDRTEQLIELDTDNDIQTATLVRHDRREWQFLYDELYTEFISVGGAK